MNIYHKLLWAGALVFLFLLYRGNQGMLHAEAGGELGIPKVTWPKENPYNEKKAQLGRRLFYDKRLSSDGTISCATCHGIEAAFTQQNPIAVGIRGQIGTRHSPSIINVAFEKHLFWDGRSNSLEEQVKGRNPSREKR